MGVCHSPCSQLPALSPLPPLHPQHFSMASPSPLSESSLKPNATHTDKSKINALKSSSAAYWVSYGSCWNVASTSLSANQKSTALTFSLGNSNSIQHSLTAAERAAHTNVALANAVLAVRERRVESTNDANWEKRTALLDADCPDGWRTARREWRDRLRSALVRVAQEAGLPLVCADNAVDQEISQRVSTSAAAVIAPSAPPRALPPAVRERCLYSPAELCQAVLSINGALPDTSTAGSDSQSTTALGRLPTWGAMRISLSAPTIAQLRAAMPELAPSSRHLGIDEHLKAWFAGEAGQLARLVADKGAVSEGRRALRRGAPSHLRAALWRLALATAIADHASSNGATRGGDDDNDDDIHFERLCGEVLRRPMLIDRLVSEEVSALSDDPHYFLFEEDTRALLLAFFHDPQVVSLCKTCPHPIVRESRVSGGPERPPVYPPAGVLPFRGFALYAAPLAYVHSGSLGRTYTLFRSLYTRHLCCLHTLGTPPHPTQRGGQGDLPSLCAAFESLLVERDAELAYHLCEIGVTALTIAFPWIVTAFSGYLEVNEVLLLWDRVIGYEDIGLMTVVVLAVGIFHFRRDDLLRCETSAEVREMLEDISDVLVVPLLQLCLFTA